MKIIPDLVLLNGVVMALSESDGDQEQEAVAIWRDRILAVGRSKEIQALGAGAETIDLHGKTVLPGFIDAHTHFVQLGLEQTVYLNLGEAGSLEAALDRVRDAAKRRPEGEWIVGRGWDESHWPEARYITREDLDRITSRHPVALFRVDGHLASVNQVALQTLNVRSEDGLLREETAWRIYDLIGFNPEQLREAVRAATRLAYRHGVTSVHDIVEPEQIQVYNELRDKLRIRVRINPRVQFLDDLSGLGLRTGFGGPFLKLGAIKIFTDGSIGAGNAALNEPYEDRDGTGALNYEPEELKWLVQTAHRNGFQLMIHAIGDRGIATALDALAEAGVTADDRPRIEHLELVSDGQIERMRQLGVVASMQPNFIGNWGLSDGMYERRLGKARTVYMNPFAKLIEAGVPLAFGSDCMPFSPRYGLHWAINTPFEIQRLSVETAIHAYTLGAAYAGFDEAEVGSITPGKLADLVVVSDNPHRIPDRIEDLEVVMTILGGEIVYRT
ncbi:MAG: amidohydrolase [Candidatus Bipolaricaulia bacterium]